MSEVNGPVNWGSLLGSCSHCRLSLFTVVPLIGRKITHSWEMKTHLCPVWAEATSFLVVCSKLYHHSRSYANEKGEVWKESYSSSLFVASGLGYWRWVLTHLSFLSCASHWSEEWVSHFTWQILKNKHVFQKKSKFYTPRGGHIHQSTRHHPVSSFVYWLSGSAIPCAFIEWEREWTWGLLCEHNENVAYGSFPHACYLEAFPSA